MRSLLLALVVLGVVGALIGIKGAQFGLLAEHGEASAQAGPPPESVAVHTVEIQRVAEHLEAVGTLRARRGVVLSNTSAGAITHLNFESGQAVEAGAVLLRLDTRMEQARLNEARATVRLARQTLERQMPLRESGVVTASEIENAEATLAQAQARAQALQAEIALKTLRAPFAGRLGIRQVDVGQYLPPGTPIVSLEGSDGLVVDFSVPQDVLPRLEEGSATVDLRWQNGEGEAHLEVPLSAISPRLDSATRSAALRADVPETPNLHPGMFVEVRLPITETQLPMVPSTSIIRSSYGDRVFVIEEGEQGLVARERFITRGIAEGDFTAIAEGLQPGDRVASSGAFKLYEGAPVVVDETPALHPSRTPELQSR